MIEMVYNGGLGNQISQFAMSRLIASLYPDSPIYYTINTKEHNGFELFKVFPSSISYVGNRTTKYNKLLQRIYKLMGKHTVIKQVYTSGYPEDPALFHLHKNHHYQLYGTWHNYNYHSIKRELYSILRWSPDISDKTKTVAEEIRQEGTTALHIRKGDYVSAGLDITSKNYYDEALNLVQSRLKIKKLFIFSDDLSYARSLMNEWRGRCAIQLVTHNTKRDSWQDMYLMSLSHCLIATNSTFSYWAGELNQRPDKLLVRPLWQAPQRKTWHNPDWITLDA